MTNNDSMSAGFLGADSALASIVPDQHDAEIAKESSRVLAPMLQGAGDVCLSITRADGTTGEVRIPGAAMRLLGSVLAEMAQGRAVSLIPLETEIGAQQAADILGVSRPYLVGLLEKGEIPFRMIGIQRSILFRDLMDYKARSDSDRRAALDELARLGQEMRLGYD